MIGRLTIHNIKLGTGDTTYRTVPTVANTSVQVTCIKTLEALVQRHKSLQSFHKLGFCFTVHFSRLRLLQVRPMPNSKNLVLLRQYFLQAGCVVSYTTVVEQVTGRSPDL